MSTFVLEEKTRAKTADYIAVEERYGAHNYHPLDVVISRAEGCWVWDVEGKKYLDFLAAYSAVNQGHCHPEILNAAIGQARQVTLTSRAFRNDQLGPFYQQFCELTGFDRFLPMNTGAEAVETAIKTARKWAYKVKGVPEGKAEILVFANNFHGRTITIVSFSTEDLYRDGFGPFTPGFRVLPYGDADAVEQAMNPNVAAVLVEPIQGEAGIIMPPEGYLKRLREITTPAQLPADGRRDPVRPRPHRQDVRLRARGHPPRRGDRRQGALGRLLPGLGHPRRRRVMGVFQPGDHGSTYGGNPMAAAVGRAALRVLVEERMVENSAELGAYFMEQLRGDRVEARQGGARQGPVDRHRAAPRGRRRPPLLRGAAAARGCSARRPTTTSSASRRR